MRSVWDLEPCWKYKVKPVLWWLGKKSNRICLRNGLVEAACLREPALMNIYG